MQVHRSWWVARKALVGWEGSSRSLRLILVNGIKVPVSRAHVAQLRAAGWLEAP
ncbi:LytTR family DNA-binding domain-containing protein [Asaia prunellae]|uniref:LytTR family DNA-binding domain-containing protein n=1 Tax=Asaia prunellae TaxID=610245 RepID=UPI000A00DA13|nr:LytTR family DNA-binding domain-containing protein [Asaia prunellae]